MEQVLFLGLLPMISLYVHLKSLEAQLQHYAEI